MSFISGEKYFSIGSFSVSSPFTPAKTATEEGEKTALAALKEARLAFQGVDGNLSHDRDIDTFIVQFQGQADFPLPPGIARREVEDIIQNYQEKSAAYEEAVSDWATRFVRSNAIESPQAALETVRKISQDLNGKWGFVERAFHMIRFRGGIEGRREKYRERVQVLNRMGICNTGFNPEETVNVVGLNLKRSQEHLVTRLLETLVKPTLPQAHFMTLEEADAFLTGSSEIGGAFTDVQRQQLAENLNALINVSGTLRKNQYEVLEMYDILGKNFVPLFNRLAEEMGLDIRVDHIIDLKEWITKSPEESGIPLFHRALLIHTFLGEAQRLASYYSDPVEVEIPQELAEEAVAVFQHRASKYYGALSSKIHSVEAIQNWLQNKAIEGWRPPAYSQWKRVALVNDFLTDLQAMKEGKSIALPQKEGETDQPEPMKKVRFLADQPQSRGVIGTVHEIPAYDAEERQGRMDGGMNPDLIASKSEGALKKAESLGVREEADRMWRQEEALNPRETSTVLVADMRYLRASLQGYAIQKLDLLRKKYAENTLPRIDTAAKAEAFLLKIAPYTYREINREFREILNRCLEAQEKEDALLQRP